MRYVDVEPDAPDREPCCLLCGATEGLVARLWLDGERYRGGLRCRDESACAARAKGQPEALPAEEADIFASSEEKP